MKLYHDIHTHITHHHKKYLFGIFGSFALVKTVILFAGLFGTLFFVQNQTHAAFSDPATTCAGVSFRISPSECVALLNLYNATDGDHWTNNTNWGNIYNLNWYGVGITTAGVTYLTLDNNNLSGYIPSLAGLSNLTSLSLYNNKISSITSNAFVGLSNLTSINLQKNLLTNAGIPNDAFMGLNNLYTLYMSYNQLTSVPVAALSVFSGSSFFSTLGLGFNLLTEVPSNAFAGLHSLGFVGLENNQITTIGNNTFAGLSNLTTLYVSNNQLSSIPNLDALPNLTTLYAENNQLTSILSLVGSPNLQQVLLSNNQLTTIPSFSGLSVLQRLALDNNKLIQLPSDTFLGLDTLSSISLDHNNLTSLPESLATLPSLRDAYYDEGDAMRYYGLSLDNNCLDTGTFSTNLLDFTILKAGLDWPSSQANCSASFVGSLFIDNNASSTISTGVTLNLSTTPTAAKMRFSNDQTTWSLRENYATTKSRTLPGSYGTKTIYAEFDTDGNGTSDGAANDSILYSTIGSSGGCTTGAYCGDLTLQILSGNSYCQYGTTLDFGTTGSSYAARNLSTGFVASGGSTAWFCEDKQGLGTRALTIQSSAIVNTTTNVSAHTIPATSVSIKNPNAYIAQGACTFASGDSHDQRVPIASAKSILGKVGTVGEGCKIITDTVSLKVDLAAAQAIGQYSGTLTITVPNF